MIDLTTSGYICCECKIVTVMIKIQLNGAGIVGSIAKIDPRNVNDASALRGVPSSDPTLTMPVLPLPTPNHKYFPDFTVPPLLTVSTPRASLLPVPYPLAKSA